MASAKISYASKPWRPTKKGLKVLTLSVLQLTSVLFASTRNFLVQRGWTLKKLFKEGRRIDETIMTKWLE